MNSMATAHVTCTDFVFNLLLSDLFWFDRSVSQLILFCLSVPVSGITDLFVCSLAVQHGCGCAVRFFAPTHRNPALS